MNEKLKLALIGNMNNNNFAMMRYFRDLGVDAHLFLFTDDGVGSLSHFKPENDTWEIEKWEPFIHRLDFDSGLWSVLVNPKKIQFPVSKKKIFEHFKSFNIFIGSGLVPVILDRCGIKLDIFYPYGTGIEFVGGRPDRYRMNHGPLIWRWLYRYIRFRQIRAIRKARFCINTEMSLTRQTFEEIGRDFIPISIPMVYNQGLLCPKSLPEHILFIQEKLNKYEFKIISHMRQMWVNDGQYSSEEWFKRSKHNDWLINGYAEYLKSTDHLNAVLLLFEYGPDVEQSKRLCAELGIEDNILWSKVLSRKEIMALIKMCDFGVGEFSVDHGVTWGGTGWEVLASGRPLLQSFNFTPDEYLVQFNHPAPPILDVKSQADVTKHLQDFGMNREKYSSIGKRSLEWFENNNGIGLARQIISLIK